MKNLNWKTLSQKYLLQDRWIKVRADVCQMPNGQIIEPYYTLEYPNWANVTAITSEREIVLIRQYRHAYGEAILELPGGAVDPGEPEMEAVQRELLEETGYIGENWEEIARVSPNPANHNNLSISFLCLNARKTAEQKLDTGEEIEVILMPLEGVKQLLYENKLVQSMQVASLFYAFRRLEQLSTL
ncbi:MAG: NUDIX hydrolase [Bacteroidota bacterium]